jgi:hypothetical protein
MGELFALPHLIIIAIVVSFVFGVLLLPIIPYWQIFKKAGFSPALSILMFIPGVSLVLLYIVAFSDWKPSRA